MNGTKLVIILVAIASISLWTMPDTVSLLADAHQFYDGGVPCIKCHEDVLIQLEDTGTVTALHRNLDSDNGCRACHVNPNNTLGRNVTQDHHSAYNPYCIECHQNASTIYGLKEVHTQVVSVANVSMLGIGINEACELCHTTLVKTVTVRNRVVFAFENDSVAVNGTPEFNGSYTATISNPEPTGLHNFNSGVSCIMCHAPIYNILNQSGKPYPKHKQFGCSGCHRGSGSHPGWTDEIPVDYHAAKIKYCSDCHELNHHHSGNPGRDCNQCHESHGGLKDGHDGHDDGMGGG